jgi:hypothetical protein
MSAKSRRRVFAVPAAGAGVAVGRVSGYDQTFSAPKSVSTLWAFGGPEMAREIAWTHKAAARCDEVNGSEYRDVK